MKLTGLHLLLTYQCNLECDHCFVWGSPRQNGTMTLQIIHEILQQARRLGTVQWIYFEGGEPFLYYPVLARGVREAADAGFRVGIVSNGYWATSRADALEWLRPFVGLVEDLSISSDLYHWNENLSPQGLLSQQAKNAAEAAEQLGISIGFICIAGAEATNATSVVGQLPAGESAVMYRGRAAEKLVARAAHQAWRQFAECPHEDLREPGRVHIDPFGDLHICQGISLGNVFSTLLSEICEAFDPNSHPITGPLLVGGPAELVHCYGLPHEESYADACHLCYEARRALRERFPEILKPDQMYGVIEAS